MLLNELFENAPEIEIEDIMSDSRQRKENSIFFCLKGLSVDGHKFYKQAIENGAKAIIYQDEIDTNYDNVVFIKVKDVTSGYTSCVNKFNGYPSQKLTMFGCTGTNGKSTISTLIKQIYPDNSCGYIGTISIEYGSVKIPPLLTTPSVYDLQYFLKKMVEENMSACALEVSSIGVEQGRVKGVDFDYAIFTNFTHDHLDYHGSMEEYFKAKKSFFDNLKVGAIAITNIDDDMGLKIVEDTLAKVVTYGIDNDADYVAKDIKLYPNRSEFTLLYKNSEYRIETNLVAIFNIYNLLAVIAALHEDGMDFASIITKLHSLKQVEGRMEIIESEFKYNIVVDFAHTPDGLEKVFKYASSITPKNKRIIVVLGSAGKRDIKKRVIFGELADKYCDMIILTEDDPRDEEVSDIAAQIAKGIKKTNHILIEDRYFAILEAIDIANPDDTILILGKGDETFIYREYSREPYIGDQNAVKEILKRKSDLMKEIGEPDDK